jgi:hypothetical protein
MISRRSKKVIPTQSCPFRKATIANQTNELATQRQGKRQLHEQLQDSEGERQGLRQVVAGRQQVFEERASQMLAREGLEHYRQEHLAQRGQELRRHNKQTNQLRQKLHSLQNAQLTKLEELVTVYREQERLFNEHRGQHERFANTRKPYATASSPTTG